MAAGRWGRRAGQAAAFTIAAGASLPMVRRYRRTAHPAARSGAAALVGRSALAIEPVDDQHGRGRIGGEAWSARTFAPGQVIPAGAVVEQLTATTLRNVIGGLDLERTLTSREQINAELRGVLDEARGSGGCGSTVSS